MLQRNLLYTGITRAKKIVVLIGTKKAIHIAIQNSKVETRNTQLSRRIEEAFND
jgi:exodeoxyribonuclease V alpha subunit